MALSPLAALGTTAHAAEDPDATKQVLSKSMKSASGTVTAFVRFKGKGAFEQTQPAGVRTGTQAPVNQSSQVQAIASPGAEPGTAGQQPVRRPGSLHHPQRSTWRGSAR